MSILIKGVEMPENCHECPCLRHDSLDGLHRYQCNNRLIVFGEFDTWIFEKRPNWCPLRHIPDDTAFIDAKALVKSFVPKQAYFTDAIIEKFWNHELVLKEGKS